MKTMFALFAVLALTGGCATMSSEPGKYSVSGMTLSPIEATRVASQSYVDQYNAATYRQAVQNGYAYPYAGGGYGNDFSFYYGGVIPAQDGGAAPQGEVTREDIERVEGKADDSLKMHKKTREYLKAKEQK